MRKLKDWIQRYMEYSSLSEAPDSFHFWTAVGCVAGALRRRVWINMGYWDWTPNFYIIFVAPPGIVSKSTTASIGTRLLREVPGIKFGPDAVTWPALAQALAGACESVLMPDGNYHSMSCLTITPSEFGTFLNPQDREMVDMLVDLWDGKPGIFRKLTKTAGEDNIVNPWLNIIGCTTPAWISGNFPEYMVGGGFTSRCVFVYAEKKRRLVAYPGRHLPKEFLETQATLIHDLEDISTLCGEFSLSPAAISYGEKWYEYHYNNRPPHLDNERLAGYLARKQTHVHKLAMVLSASRGNSLCIEEHDLKKAVSVLSSLEADMPQVFQRIGQTDITKAATAIVKIIESKGRVEHSELYRAVWHGLPAKDFDHALQSAITAGYIGLKQEGTKIFVYKREIDNGLQNTRPAESA